MGSDLLFLLEKLKTGNEENRRTVDHAKVHLKTKKRTDILQTHAGFKAKSLGILCEFQGFFMQNPAVFRNRLNFRLFRYALGQYRIILSADTASEVRQMLSQKRR